MATCDDLRAIPLFASLDEPTLKDIGRRVHRYTFRPGQRIMVEGEQAPGLFIVLQGRVRLSCTARDGREQVLAMVEPCENLNLVSTFDGQPNPTTAQARSPVVCLLLPSHDMLELTRRHPDLALAALNQMAGQLRELVKLVEDLAFRSVRERLARYLLAETTGGTAEVTHQELAEHTGTVREIAGRALRRFAEEKLVRMERGRIIVLDPEGLSHILEKSDTHR